MSMPTIGATPPEPAPLRGPRTPERKHANDRASGTMVTDTLRSWLQQRVEGPPPDGVVWRLLEQGWARASRPVRPLRVPPGVRVVCIGGATLGGSGKTPLAVACAAALASGSTRVALVGHAHRAAPAFAQVVPPDGSVTVHGDEALECAQRLADSSAVVVVGPTRQSAVELAAGLADTLVLDGPLQLAPRRAALSLLAVDPHAPWGSGACPPRGDLRAPSPDLLAACDAVVVVGGSTDAGGPPDATAFDGKPVFRASARVGGVRVNGEVLPLDRLAGRRVGLLTALAHPERVLAALAAHGVRPAVHLRGPDHGPLPRPPSSALDVELWLATHKCSLHRQPIVSTPPIGGAGAPLGVIDYRLDLPGDLLARLAG